VRHAEKGDDACVEIRSKKEKERLQSSSLHFFFFNSGGALKADGDLGLFAHAKNHFGMTLSLSLSLVLFFRGERRQPLGREKSGFFQKVDISKLENFKFGAKTFIWVFCKSVKFSIKNAVSEKSLILFWIVMMNL